MPQLHVRLKRKCSNLNKGLFSNQIRDNPLSDLFGVIENDIYYFYCRTFTIKRQVFNDTVIVFQFLYINLTRFAI